MPEFDALTSREFCEPSHVAQVAALKRALDLWTMDERFHEVYRADSARAVADAGLAIDPQDIELLIGRDASWILEDAVDTEGDGLPEPVAWYREFLRRRIVGSLQFREACAPAEPRFRDWRKRQMLRCRRELGPDAQLLAHQPLTFELSSGCSMTCPFCALAAGRLKGVWRYTPANAALWRDVLARMHALIGDAAGRGTCYCATEPLDNPDYEKFLQDYYDEYGMVPQTTTAAATRDVERTRRLLRWGQHAYVHFDRISVLSARDRDRIFEEFSPEELLYADLLPRFGEAGRNGLTKAGRNIDATRGMAGTIACNSGFVVNMCEHTIRLTTPTTASSAHPTGELIYEEAAFTDGPDLESVVRGMIERHMRRTLDLASIFSATPS